MITVELTELWQERTPGSLPENLLVVHGTLARRQILKLGASAAAGIGGVLLDGCGMNTRGAPGIASAGCAKLTDIEHVVTVIQENRSFDHYFGTYRGVRGF